MTPMLEERFRGRHSAPKRRRRKKKGGAAFVLLTVLLVAAAAVLAVVFLRPGAAPAKPENRPEQPLAPASQPDTAAQEQPPKEESAPPSLRDAAGEPINVWLNGTAVSGLLIDGTSYISAEDITACLPEFTWRGDGNSWSYTGSSPYCRGDAPVISCGENAASAAGDGIRYGEEYWLPLRRLTDDFSARLMWDSAAMEAYITFTPRVDISRLSGYEIPILMYHAVSDDIWGLEGLFVSPSSMREQLEYLRDNGYDPIFFSDLSHIEDYDKPVLLTFDDGYTDNYEELFPLLKEYDTKATVFVVSSALGYGHTMTAENAREMADSGLVDIQSHTADHYELASLDRDGQEDQLARSQRELALVTKRIPYVLAYPNGGHDDTTKELGAEYYDFGILKDGGVWYPDEDRFAVTRMRVDRSHGIEAFAAMLD